METSHIFLLGPSLFLLETLPSVKTRESRNTHSQRTWEKVCEDNQTYVQLFCVFFVVTKVAVVAFNRVLNLSMEIQEFKGK